MDKQFRPLTVEQQVTDGCCSQRGLCETSVLSKRTMLAYVPLRRTPSASVSEWE